MAAHALGEQGVFGVQLQTGLIIGFVRAIARDAHVAGRHPLHRSVVIEQHLGRREAGVNLHPHLGCTFTQPARQIGERTGVGALVVHYRWQQRMRHRPLFRLGQDPVVVFRHRRLCQRAVAVAPVRQQLVHGTRVDHRTRQDMRADLRPFLQHTNAQLPLALGGELFQPNRCRQAGRSGPHDDHIERHRLTLIHVLASFRPKRSIPDRSRISTEPVRALLRRPPVAVLTGDLWRHFPELSGATSTRTSARSSPVRCHGGATRASMTR